MKFLYFLMTMAFVIFFVTFAFQNPGDVHLKYYGYLDHQVAVYLIVFVAFFAGIIVTGLMGIVERFKLTMTINRLYRKIDDLERRNLNLLKSVPTSNDTKAL